VQDLGPFIYVVIFAFLLIEGEAVMFTSAYLLRMGLLKWSYLLPVVVVGVLLGDILWFRFGSRMEMNLPWVHKWVTRVAGPVKKFLEKRPYRTIFVMKYAYGLGRATQVCAGTIGMSARTFIKADLLASFCWIAAIGGVGYFGAASIEHYKHYLKYAEVGILMGIVLIVIISHAVSRYEMKELNK
jgi:membrane protein DedA with SNARE-associated domain